MPYVTELPAGYISVASDGSISITGSPSLSDALNDSVEFSKYDVDSTTVSTGDDIALVDAGGNPVTGTGTYLGSGTLSFAPVGGSAGPLSLQIQVAPITGSLIEVDGHYYIITDEPLDNDHIEATVTLNVALPGPDFSLSATAPLSNLADAFADQIDALPGPIADAVAGFVHGLDAPFAAAANSAVASLVNDTGVDLILTDDEVICFAAGTLIETDRGPVRVEELAIGDMVWTRDDGFQPIRWIGSAMVPAEMLARKPNLRPIRIRAGALGMNLPESDLLVSPQHRILVRSKISEKMFGVIEVLVPAKQLLQIAGIDYAEDMAEVEYFHFLFERHQIVRSNGAETESLFTGPQALRTLSPAARGEVFALFPQLRDADYMPQAIRPLPSGRKSRKLAQRHASKQRVLVS